MPDDEIKQTKDAAGAYTKFAFEARKKYIGIRERQDPEIRKLYIRLADRVAARINSTSRPLTPVKQAHLRRVEQMLRDETDKLHDGVSGILRRDITAAVEAGAGMSSGITFKLLESGGIKIDDDIRSSYFRVNNRAVESAWRRYTKGFKLSDRIWRQSKKAREAVQNILQEAVATGQNAVDTARMLQQYMRKGAGSLAADYPNMMERLQVPKDISYEALRLARAETSNAYWEGAIASGQNSPSYKGVRWILSHSHPMADICDAYADHDEGLGRGVYRPGNEPSYPHPNCICTIVAAHEQPEDFVQRLKRWKKDPAAEPNIEKWYQGVHRKEQSGGTVAKPEFLRINKNDQEYDDTADRRRIKEDLAIIPPSHQKLLEQEGVTVQTGYEISRYDRENKVIQAGKNPVPGELFHEVGHAIETKLDSYSSKKFLEVLYGETEAVSLENVIYDKDTFGRPIIRVEIEKLISEYQGRLYESVGIFTDDMKINFMAMREYFSEGYREFITNPEHLKRKDKALFEYIKEVI